MDFSCDIRDDDDDDDDYYYYTKPWKEIYT